MRNKLLFAGIVVVVAGGLWYGLSDSGAPQQTISAVSTTQGSPTQENADQRLVATLLSLRAVNLSGNIFQDPAFQSLRDFSTTIVAEPVGRHDPFASLGNDSGTVSAPVPANATPAKRPAGGKR